MKTMNAHFICSPTRSLSLVFALILTLSPLGQLPAQAQTSALQPPDTVASNSSQLFRLEKVSVSGGAELVTINARLVGLESEKGDSWVPLVSILRDTLGDLNQENDKLRYVWALTYTRPSIKQRLAAAVPFLYTRVGNEKVISTRVPPPAIDLAAPESEVWEKIFWTALQNVLLDPYGTPIKASTSSYRRNSSDYRKSHIIRALSVLALYQELKGERSFSDSEMAEIQARLMLTDKTFGGLVDDLNLESYYGRKTTQVRDQRGHNWELLRQKAEAESLYFQPLTMPDGSATHALLWVAKRDLATHTNQSYDGRFLNIASPWGDKRLLNWKGYTERRYLDADGQFVSSETPGSQQVELVPLALYGLDNPKIPMLLVDFRDGYNPKKREMSRRVLNDITRNVLSVSKFGNLPFFLGRTVYDFVTGRRGIDVNQPSRLQTYAQLKLLIALNDSLEAPLREEVNGRLERISLNPFENDMKSEANIARAQYQALLAFAKNPGGLAAKLERDRRAEMTSLEHGKTAQLAFRLANVLSFGSYVHRESFSDDMQARLDIARRLSYHTKFLEQVSKSKSQIDVAWNLEEVRRSLGFIADHGALAGSNAVAAAAKIFARTQDDETRRACLDSLTRISRPKAKTELIRISQNTAFDIAYREIAANHLQRKVEHSEPIAVTVRDAPPKVGQP